MQIAQTIEAVRSLVSQARRQGRRVGLVPTMGALHRGHVSLIEAARAACDFVVVSIFVNPTQFGPGEDFQAYPRPMDEDLRACREAGVDVVFAPSAQQMYRRSQKAWVDVEGLTEGLCGRSRPGHFRGVATVCAKLLNIVGPDAAFFGQKDGQQAAVVRRMAEDLDMPLEIVVCPTVREADGLAMSSRNQYLTARERAVAPLVYKSLEAARAAVEKGERNAEAIQEQMRRVLGQSELIQPEYVSVVDAETMEELKQVAGRVMIAVAVRLGTARLIDNIVIEPAA
ncbi:MAG TPA: pantoate--beta-alanine ligase [Phycisphaerales bacterium]|nr:pantoate--beta-alanine ligase [Phycisphaerales bacterium]